LLDTMGNLKGELDLIGIDTLFQALSTRQAEGFLDVQCGEQRIVLAIAPRGIRVVSGVRRTKPLGEILIRAGKITPEQLEEMLGEQRKSSAPLGELVIQRGIVPRSVIESALRKQVAEEIHELFSWTGGQFEFQPAAAGTPHPDEGPRSSIVLDGNVMGIMLEAARRTDELQQIRALIPDDQLIPVMMELPGALDDPGLDRPAVEEIVPLVDGQRSVEDILEASLHPKFTVLRTLYGLAMGLVLKIRDRSRRDGPSTVLGKTGGKDTKMRTRRGRAVLVLSDSPTFRPALSLRIHGSGYTVFEERTSAELSRVLERNHADVIVADVSIDTPTGQDYCRQLKELAQVPFVVLTANGGTHLTVQALDCGARYILTKPLDEARLLERLAEILS
jgi:CheY-like chemotaxis protein